MSQLQEQKSRNHLFQVNTEVLMRNDIGTITVTVKNMETSKSVNIKDARMVSRNLKVISDSYFNIGRLGPGESLNLTFTIKATCPDGIYYPGILVEGEDAQNIRYSFLATVDSSYLTIGVKDIPDEIFIGERARIELAVGNPRQNTVTGVRIVTEGREVIPSEVFIGTLSPDDSKTASFNFTSQTNGVHVLNFRLEFRNGDNHYYTELSVPLNVTESKKRAELILTGIEVESMSDQNVYKITGDVNNAGLKETKSVVMKVGDAEGIEAMHPYKSYFMGLLSPDDFSSFELDVKVCGNETQVPLVIEYRDEDGNMFLKTESLDNVSVSIEAGEFISVMGLSGSVKTTLLIGCLDTPTSGRVIIGGRTINGPGDDQLTKLRRDKSGSCFSSLISYPH